MFDKNAESLINWFENLEEKCQNLLFDKSASWFQNTLELNDIESAFNSTIRVYKSGKYYLVRCNAKSNPNSDPQVKIYNEDEETIPYADINNEVKMISILEIQGIKFTSRNFQIEIEIKQIMTINDEPIFESCLIKTNNLKKDKQENIEKNQEDSKIDLGINTDINKTLEENKEQECLDIIENFNNSLNIDESFDNIDNTNQNIDSKNINNYLDKEIVSDKDELNINLEFEDLDTLEIDDNKDLKEVDIDINNANNLETLTLKKPNQVYFELYKEAREKAKIAKKAAIIAYLEAKNIKKTYMIEDLIDSDSDFDAEIDDVSESELEDL
jgi:hypothetical protein